ncbi:helix-turn-helix domain-containing protein [Nocardioides sp. SYSU DS0651]|uniref:helix-turn-helix domain-containing protein n=1 Tax=Nocardioides sp. SYSU DS0651 TaxID=3415955 RepID=UPI003F4B0AE4
MGYLEQVVDELEAVEPELRFGEFVKRCRRLTGKSQREWVEELGGVMTVSYLGLVEKGQRIPSEEKTRLLADKLGEDPVLLVGLRNQSRWARATEGLAKLGTGQTTTVDLTSALSQVDADDLLPRRRGRPSKADAVRGDLIRKLAEMDERDLLRISGYVDAILENRAT